MNIKLPMSKTTRQKIIEIAKPLFNKEGYRASTLNQLAQSIGISRGNLTYHFKDKTDLLDAILADLWSRYEQLMASTTQFPSWESTHTSTLAFHELQKDFSFIFFDRHLLMMPAIKDQVQKIQNHHLKWQMSIIHFSMQIGNMKQETIPGTYESLCNTIWKTSFFWLLSEEIAEPKNQNTWERYVWSIILPHFTEKGIVSFKEHFGKDYMMTLGNRVEDYQQVYFAL